MSRLIESIKLQDGRFLNLPYHERRMRRSLRGLFGIELPVELEKWLREKQFPENGLFKCRIVYDQASKEATFTPYVPKRIRRVKIVEDDSISYQFKFLDRSPLDRLFALRGDCDDVMIVSNGHVTDCSFSNVVFRKGANWYTPVSPLLNGTMRENLLEKNKVLAVEIRKSDIRSFETFKLINAMLEFDSPEIEVSEIVF